VVQYRWTETEADFCTKNTKTDVCEKAVTLGCKKYTDDNSEESDVQMCEDNVVGVKPNEVKSCPATECSKNFIFDLIQEAYILCLQSCHLKKLKTFYKKAQGIHKTFNKMF
jgi:hypothetical protein